MTRPRPYQWNARVVRLASGLQVVELAFATASEATPAVRMHGRDALALAEELAALSDLAAELNDRVVAEMTEAAQEDAR